MIKDDAVAGRTIKSVDTALTILEVLSENEGAQLAELAAEMEVSKSTIHHHLATLARREYVVKTDGEYHPGPRFLAFGGQARENERLYQIGRQYVDRLAAETEETAKLVIESHGIGITLYQKTGSNVSEPRTHVGSTEDLHSTAAGKAFLACLSSDEIDDILDDRDLARHTENTITRRKELEEQLETIRETGIAFDDEEQTEGIRCVAAPIRTEENAFVGAVSISAPTSRVPDERFETEFPNSIRNVVGALQIDTTYSKWGNES